MNADDFERRLQRQTLRALPPIWRHDILLAARTARLRPPEGEAKLAAILRGWLWPHPWAWASLAGCWVVVALLQTAAGLPFVASARLTSGSTTVWALQAADWGELPGPAFTPEFPRPAPARLPVLPPPTSSWVRRHETQAA